MVFGAPSGITFGVGVSSGLTIVVGNFNGETITGDDRFGERLTRFRLELRGVVRVPRGDVCQIEPPDTGLGREGRRAPSGTVMRLRGPIGLFVSEGGFVDQQRRTFRDLDGRLGGAGVSGVNHHTPGTGRAHHVCRHHSAPIELDGVPPVQFSEELPFGYPQRPGALDIEAAAPLVLHEGVPQRGNTMIRRKSDHVIFVEFHARTGTKLLDFEWKRHPVHAQAHRLFERGAGLGGTEDTERIGPPLKRHRPQEPRDTEEVIGVEMSHEYVPDSEAGAVTHHLALRPLATVEEEGIPLPLEGDRTHVATHRRSRRGGTEEGDSNHALSLPGVFARRLCSTPVLEVSAEPVLWLFQPQRK